MFVNDRELRTSSQDLTTTSKYNAMDNHTKPNASLFDVYLRLRPSFTPSTERFIDVEECADNFPKHITIKPPSNDHRKRAVERFAFTRVFEENASQLDLFSGTGVVPLIQGVLAAEGQVARDGLLATLGVTGSGKVSSRALWLYFKANCWNRATRFSVRKRSAD